MVLVANRRTKSQMDSDLSLFLGENTVKFTTWLCHVLKKLEQVTLQTNTTTPTAVTTTEAVPVTAPTTTASAPITTAAAVGIAKNKTIIQIDESVGVEPKSSSKKSKSKHLEKSAAAATTTTTASKDEPKVQFKLKRPLVGKSNFELLHDENSSSSGSTTKKLQKIV